MAVPFGALALVLAGLLVVLGAPAASAEPPGRLDEQVTDSAGVLDVPAATERVEQLQADTGTQLWVVFTDTFDDPTDGEAWAAETHEQSQLGQQAVLLAVAVDDGAYGFRVPDGSGVDRQEFAQVDAETLRQLEAGDFDAAVDAAADGVEAAVTDSGATSGGQGGSVGPGVGGLFVLLVLGVVLLVLVVAVLGAVSRRRRRAAAEPGGAGGRGAPAEPPVPLDELARRAGAALVATDDAVDASAQELGFAAAEFGDEASAPFDRALERARAELSAAFTAHRRAGGTDELPDDADLGTPPPTDDDRRALLEEVLARTRAADAVLDEQSDAFAALRDVERSLPALLPQLDAELDRLARRAPSDLARVESLRERYDTAALGAVGGSREQVERLLEYTRDELAQARDDVAGGRSGEAAVDARSARDALTQVGALLDAATRLEGDLAAAAAQLDDAAAETRTDLAEARALLDRGAGDAELAGLVARAETALAAAGTAGGRDPLTALRRLEEADVALDRALAAVREGRERADRARSSLAHALPAARAEVAAAESFVRTRRGAVGSAARTSLAQARALLGQAEQLADPDPVRALALAQHADALAEQAQQEAASDVDGWDGWGGGGGGYGGGYGQGYGGRYRGQRSGGSVEAAVLGGIIGAVLGGGGGRGGGGGFGGSGGFGGGGFGGGGSFGGGGGFGGGGRF